VQELRAKLIQAVHKRRLDLSVINEAKRAREQVSRQMKAMREQGRKLAGELKGALTESARRREAREQALSQIAELKAELTGKTQELRRKSHELAELARESASRARTILEKRQPAPSPPSLEPHAGAQSAAPDAPVAATPASSSEPRSE
jgi:methyl-accepting chemotaxis protein